MHVATLLFEEMFEINCNGRLKSSDDIFPNWSENDRFGIIIDTALGGLGAAHLIQLATVKFYDVKPERRQRKAVYPEVYAFHVEVSHGSHADFDFWPARREVIVGSEPRDMLDAINDRGITRLALPQRGARNAAHRPKEIECALDRLTSAFYYSPKGRVDDPDFTIRGIKSTTEYNVNRVLKAGLRPVGSGRASLSRGASKEIDPAFFDHLAMFSASLTSEERRRAADYRQALGPKGMARESYRFAEVADALARL